jgi:hypothetical protein
MTKPGFVLRRLKALFLSDDIVEQENVLALYNKNRDKQIEKECYCGHTITCDCGNPGISEFKSSILSNALKENM